MEPNVISFELRETFHVNGQRKRLLETWTMHPAPEEPGSYFLTGRVATELYGEVENLRFTTTSIVKSRRGRTLITKSDSEYTLGQPNIGQDENQYLEIPSC